MDNNCKGCIYYRKFASLYETLYACHYCVDTGNLRECDPKVCDKKDTNPEHKVVDKSNLTEWLAKSRLKVSNGY